MKTSHILTILLFIASPSYGASPSTLFVNNNTGIVNGVTVTGAATGSAPAIAASGTDTNVGLILNTQGTGVVSIGTTSAGSELGVYGGVNIGTSYVGTASPANGLIVQGSVGIGTASPFYTLQTRTGADENYTVRLPGTVGSGVEMASINDSNTLAEPMAFVASEYVFNSIGNVGIGTTSPLIGTGLDGLHVYGTIDNTGAILAQTTADGAYIDIQNNGTFKAFMGLNSSGQIDFTIGHYGTMSGPGMAFYYGASPVEAMRINSSGDVGIGNTSPAYLLHVGSGAASGVVMELQNSSGACTHTPSASSETVSCSSDMKLKDNIQDSEKDALAWADDMRIRDFTVKSTGERKTGVVAQEMLPSHPDMVHKNADGFYSVDEPNPWMLIKTIQELHDLMAAQQDALAKQQDEIDELKQTIEKMVQQK